VDQEEEQMNMKHMNYLDNVARHDLETLRLKEETYKGSWKKRGGVGTYMMLARKMDRLENFAAKHGYDIFQALMNDEFPGEDGTVLAEIRDLRCYLLLVEAEYLARMSHMGSPEDGSHHARESD
jgi:hypothetical protein